MRVHPRAANEQEWCARRLASKDIDRELVTVSRLALHSGSRANSAAFICVAMQSAGNGRAQHHQHQDQRAEHSVERKRHCSETEEAADLELSPVRRKRRIDDANASATLAKGIEHLLAPDSTARLVLCAADDLTRSLRKDLFSLLKHNMRDMYEDEGWEWNTLEKKAELFADEARLLVCYSPDEEQELLGFSHFRFTLDDDGDPAEAVLYVYELQLADGARRKGLGRRMMAVLEALAASTGMTKTMLTVFKANEPAMLFYKAAGYVLDPSTPSQWERDETYEILSKRICFESRGESAAEQQQQTSQQTDLRVSPTPAAESQLADREQQHKEQQQQQQQQTHDDPLQSGAAQSTSQQQPQQTSNQQQAASLSSTQTLHEHPSQTPQSALQQQQLQSLCA